jgi:hypothetical protein
MNKIIIGILLILAANTSFGQSILNPDEIRVKKNFVLSSDSSTKKYQWELKLLKYPGMDTGLYVRVNTGSGVNYWKVAGKPESWVVRSQTGLTLTRKRTANIDSLILDGTPLSSIPWGNVTGTLSAQTDLQAAINARQLFDADLTAISGLSPVNDNIMQYKAGAWTSRTIPQFKVDLSLVEADIPSLDQSKIVGLGSALSNKEPVISTGSVTEYIAANKTVRNFKADVVANAPNFYLYNPLLGDTLLRRVNDSSVMVKSLLFGYGAKKVTESDTTITIGADSTQVVSIGRHNAAVALRAPLASPTFTGTVTLPAATVVNGVTLSTAAGTGVYLRGDGTYVAPPGSGTVTSASVVSANGFAGSVATATTTPAITLTTTITGVLKGNGTAISAATAGTDYTTPSSTETMTNKRITARVNTVASSATPTPTSDNSDMYTVTALAAGATFAAPTGTPTDGQVLLIRIKDNGTARTLAWNAIYRAGSDFALPTTTVISKTMYVQFIYNTADTKWDCVGLSQGY